MTSSAHENGGALRFGLPSKGRLQSMLAEYLEHYGIKFVRSGGEREYAGELRGVDNVEPVFLQAGEIPAKLAAGEIHLGVTGEDLVRERVVDWERRIKMMRALGFGHADVIVAAPKCWIDVSTTADLDDVAAEFRERHGHPLRVATKYARLARAFFRERGVANYRLVDSQGATEGVIASGGAEAIVDITSSGETLRANHLKILDDGLILSSEAQLCASYVAPWPEPTRAALRALLDRLSGGERTAHICARIDASSLQRAEAALARLKAQVTREAAQDGAICVIPADQAGFAVDILTAAGAEQIETKIDAADAQSGQTLYEAFLSARDQASGP